MAKYTEEELKEELENSEYKYGFYTDIESDTFPKGLNEEEKRAAMDDRLARGGFPYMAGDARAASLGKYQV